MTEQDDGNGELLDTGNHPQFFAHEIGDVAIIGANATIVLAKWQKINGVLRRCIAGEIIRPISTLPPHVVALWQAMYAAGIDRVFN